MTSSADAGARARALLSLEGLSVGDAFGDRFFLPAAELEPAIVARWEPAGPTWRFTDDTEMALSIVDELVEHGAVDAGRLARRFAERMDGRRKYGGSAHAVLTGIRDGGDWSRLSRGAFDGKGSFGNGAAMRVAPLGAYFASDVERAAHEARASAAPTHAHEEGVAGAIAGAVATAFAWSTRGEPFDRARFVDAVLALTPGTFVRETIEEARALFDVGDVVRVASALGNGSGVSAPDTVPLCLWAVARHPDDFAEALWTTVSALGDRDTTCAIVGGILAARVGHEGIPATWRERRESLGVAYEAARG